MLTFHACAVLRRLSARAPGGQCGARRELRRTERLFWVRGGRGSKDMEYTAASREEADQLVRALAQIDELLDPAATSAAQTAPQALVDVRLKVRQALVRLRTDVAALEEVEKADVFGTNPVFATQRYQLIARIEETKVSFEFDLLAALRRATQNALAAAKEQKPESDALGIAERLLDQSSRAVTLVARFLPIANAIAALVTGIAPAPIA